MKSTGRDVVVTVKLWCCVCLFVTPERKLCDGLNVTGLDCTGKDATGPGSTGHKRNSTRQNRTGQDGTGQDKTGLLLMV